MSHFTRLKTRLQDKAALIAALQDLGYTVIDKPGQIRGYGATSQAVEFKFRPSPLSYEIGFQRSTEGYEIISDWFGVRGLKRDEFIRKLTQRYAYHLARQQLEAQGFTLAEEQVDAQGCIHLRLRRMV